MAKSVEEIRTDITNQYNALVPQLDLSKGSAERDIFVEAPISGVLVPIWKSIEILESVYALFSNADNIPADVLDSLANNNFNVFRTQATPATGVVTFYASAFPETITIPAGTRVQTASNAPKVYYTINGASFTPADAPIYFNATNRRYEFNLSVRSQNIGSGNTTGKGTVTVLTSPINGISGVVNTAALVDGVDAESNSQLVSKIQQANLSRNIDTTSGLNVFFTQFSTNFTIVKYGDTDFKRSKFPGGRDVYFTESTENTQTDTFVVPSANFTGSFVLSQQPALAITSVVGNVSGVLPTALYTLTNDTGLLSGSIKAKDAITILSPGINDSSLSVSYSYNSFPQSVTDELASPGNDTLNRDVLIRQGNAVPVTVTLKVRLGVGVNVSSVSNDINAAVATYVDSLKLGEKIIRNTILNACQVSGVLAIDYTSFKIDAPGGVVDGNGDITLTKAQYATFATVDVSELI